MELHGIFLWNSLENVLILYVKYRWRNFHGNWFPYPPWNSMATFSMEFHGKCPNPPWRYFPWNSMEIDVPINPPWNSMEVFHTGLTRIWTFDVLKTKDKKSPTYSLIKFNK